MDARPAWSAGQRPTTIAILAMGGEGGGVLSNWIVEMAEAAGHSAQSTSVAGVAQRTGATIYYVELYPPLERDHAVGPRAEPVLSMMPSPGEVDIVIASELMEAGRAVQRGLVTPDRTTLIASTNRVYSIAERSAPGDGRVDADRLLESARTAARRFVGADFMAMAERSGSVISASLFGALAGSGGLPFSREQFVAAIAGHGKAKAVEASLAAFETGLEAARRSLARVAAAPEPGGAATERTPAATAGASRPVAVEIMRRPPADPTASAAEAEQRRVVEAAERPEDFVGPVLQAQALRIGREFPAAARLMLLRGAQRTALYQDVGYTDRYLDRVARLARHERQPDGAARLTAEAARHVALWMCYQDTIQVALQKIRRERLRKVRQEARAGEDALMQVREFLHPQVEELTDTMPTALGRRLAASRWFARAVHVVAHKGMVVNTTSITGFTTLAALARLRPLRPRSLRFGREQAAIEGWLDLTDAQAALDYDLACEIVMCERVLKGYGQTHHHGTESFTVLMQAARDLAGRPDAASTLARLRTAALADEDGSRLNAELTSVGEQPVA
jgi:indolepyruvate ferredoxin oxidoreductase beta subunit